jgi:UDPglucose 6-dehydrogenase
VNAERIEAIAQKLRGSLVRLAGRRIAVLGLAFKAGTADLRSSPSLALVERLARAGASVTAFDPMIDDIDVDAGSGVTVAGEVASALADADAAVIATADPSFAALEPASVAAAMRGRVLVDAAGMLAAGAFGDAGFLVLGAGWSETPSMRASQTA